MSYSLAGWFRVDTFIISIPARMRCPSHPDNISNTTNSPTMEVSFNLTMFILFSIVLSILVLIPEAFLSSKSAQCHRGTASKITTITTTSYHLPLLRPIHFRPHFALLAFQVFRLVSEMFLLQSASIPRTYTMH